MKGLASNSIIVIGILVLVIGMISAAFVSLNKVKLPDDKEQRIKGNPGKISSSIARLADRCWKKSNYGKAPRNKNCYRIHLFPTDKTRPQKILSKLKELKETQIELPDNIPNREMEISISYSSTRKKIKVTKLNVCKTQKGENCHSLDCSCQTACLPKFDSNGDGTKETNQKGCITSADFQPQTMPCKSKTKLCNKYPTDFQKIKTENQKAKIDIQNQIGYINASITKTPLENPQWKKKRLNTKNLFSSKEKFGFGNAQRRLFTEKAKLNIENLQPGNYALFIWGCNLENSYPKDCKWLKPYRFQVE